MIMTVNSRRGGSDFIPVIGINITPMPDMKREEINKKKIAPQLLEKMEKEPQNKPFQIIVMFKPKPEELTGSKNPKKIEEVVSKYQKPFVDFLKENGIGEINTLWIINGLSTAASKNLIFELTKFKDVKDIFEDSPVKAID